MLIFITLVTKLLPLYLTIALGYIASRFLEMRGRSVAGAMIYIITPIVLFSGAMSAPIRPELLVLPLLVWLIAMSISFVFLKIGKLYFKDARANILALTVGTGNTGYFGIPVALILFGPDALAVYILCMLGTTLNENSIGFYLAAKGKESARQAFARVLKLPTLYAVMIAICLNLNEVALPHLFDSFFINMRGAYTILGMMIIGIGIADYTSTKFDGRFLGLAFIGKFVAWPLAVWGVCLLDYYYVGLFDTQVYKSLILVAITPIAANTVVIATLLNTYPKEVATTTLLSTFFALVYIPAVVAWMPVA